MAAEALADTAATITTTIMTTNKINAKIPNNPNMVSYPFKTCILYYTTGISKWKPLPALSFRIL